MLLPADVAPAVLAVGAAVDDLHARLRVTVTDEAVMYAHLHATGLLRRTRLLPLDVFEPAITRDGATTQRYLSREHVGAATPGFWARQVQPPPYTEREVYLHPLLDTWGPD